MPKSRNRKKRKATPPSGVVTPETHAMLLKQKEAFRKNGSGAATQMTALDPVPDL